MFTGIIKKTVKAINIDKRPDHLLVSFSVPDDWKITEGESINIDGICSTATKVGETFSIFYIDETLKRSNISSLDEGHKFNLERSLKLSDLMSGHIVQGQVDTTATVVSVKHEGDINELKFTLPPELTKYIIYKGSITVNGVSLTVTLVDDSSFSVALIPHTLLHTNIGDLKVGDLVNIEVDMMAKYIEKLLTKKSA